MRSAFNTTVFINVTSVTALPHVRMRHFVVVVFHMFFNSRAGDSEFPVVTIA